MFKVGLTLIYGNGIAKKLKSVNGAFTFHDLKIWCSVALWGVTLKRGFFRKMSRACIREVLRDVHSPSLNQTFWTNNLLALIRNENHKN